jgi:tRNA(fMet)-specific endonuclease VapC
MILCDTNILIEFYKNNQQISAVLRDIGPENIAISAVTAAELYYGALNKQELHKIKAHLALLHNYPITLPISNRFLMLMESLCPQPQIKFARCFNCCYRLNS